MIGGELGAQRERLEDPDQVADRHALVEHRLQHLLDLAEAEQPRGQFLDHHRMGALDHVGQGTDILPAEQPAGVVADHLGEVGDDHRRPVDDRRAGELGLVVQFGRDPLAGQAEDRLDAGPSGQRLQALADRQDGAGRCLPGPGVGAGDPDRVRRQRQVQVVAGAHRRHDDAQLHRHLAAQRAYPVEQIAAADVDQVDQVRREGQFQRVDPHLAEQRFGRVRRGHLDRLGDGRGLLRKLVLDPLGDHQDCHADQQERHLGQARDDAQREGRGAADAQRQLVLAELLGDALTHVAGGGRPGHDQTGGDREQQSRHLGDQAVADAQHAELVHRVGRRQPVLEDADREAADQVDQRDDDGRDGVALDELGATVHRAVELGLGGHLGAALLRPGLVDQAGVQVGVDRHLLTGHRVEGEPGADLGDPLGTLGHHDQLDDDQDREDHQADDQVAPDDEAAERVDHLARVAVAQHQPGRADVQRQPEQRHHQQQGREDREVERLLDEHAGQQHQQGDRDVDGDEQVEQEGRQRDDHHDDDADDPDGYGELAEVPAFHDTSARRSVAVTGTPVAPPRPDLPCSSPAM